MKRQTSHTAIIAVIFSWLFFTPLSASAVIVSSVAELSAAINSANGGGDKTIVISSGTYSLNGVYLMITSDGVTVRGNSSNRADVILDGAYITTEIFQIVASNVTIADMTLKRAYYHPIHVIGGNSADISGIKIDNVHIVDPGQQAIKINQNAAATHSVNNGVISNSKIELTSAGRNQVWNINGSCYTGGVDGHHASAWTIADNTIEGFWCTGGLSEHGIHFWSDSSNTVVERNTIIDCDRGIGFGLGDSGHSGGIIRNNMIYHGASQGQADVGIGLESASNAQVYNNTIFFDHAYPNAIEYRFASSSGISIINNLTNRAITSRDLGTASLSHNLTNAQSGWFTNAGFGDLHLVSKNSAAVNKGIVVTGLTDDFDKQKRPMGGGIDIGADEYETINNPNLSWLMLLIGQ